MNYVPIIPGLVQDISTVIYEQMDGLSQWRMSMVSKEWDNFCADQIEPIRSGKEFKTAVNSCDILRIMKDIYRLNENCLMRWVCEAGNIELINILFKRGNESYDAGLFGACKGGHLDVMNMMIGKGANYWFDGLLGACVGGTMDMISLMITYSTTGSNYQKHYASTNIVRNDLDEGTQPLDYVLLEACRGGNIDVVRMIIDNYCNDGIRWEYGLRGAFAGCDVNIADIMIDKCASNQFAWDFGLMGACERGNIVFVNRTIEIGANDWNYGMFGACKSGNIFLIEMMIEKGADEWNGGLIYACEGGHIDIVQTMINYGATHLNQGLSVACDGGHIEIAKLLLDLGDGVKCNCGRSRINH